MRGSRYGDEQRCEAVVTYLLTGNATLAATLSGVPGRTVRHWCQPEGAPQAPYIAKLCHGQGSAALIRARSIIIDRVADQALDWVENGYDPFK